MKRFWTAAALLLVLAALCGCSSMSFADYQQMTEQREAEQTDDITISVPTPSPSPTPRPTIDIPMPTVTRAPAQIPNLPYDFDSSNMYLPVPTPEELYPGGSGQELFFDSKSMDMFFMIDAAGWTYDTKTKSGTVIFYPKGTKVGDAKTTIAIALRKDVADRKAMEAELKARIETAYPDARWKSLNIESAGRYTGYIVPYYFGETKGCIATWETETGPYECVMVCPKDEYETTEFLLIRSLATFMTIDEAYN